MINITKLSASSQNFISELSTARSSKRPEFSLSLARCLANRIELPSSPVTDLREYFNHSESIELSALIYSLNELVVLDIETVLDLVYKFFQLRYSFIHPTSTFIGINKETAIVDFFGISKALSVGSIDCITEHISDMTRYNLSILALLKDLELGELV